MVRNLDDVRNELAKISQASNDERDSVIAKAYTLPTFTTNRTLVLPTTDAAPSLSTTNQAFPQLEQGLSIYPVFRAHLAGSQNLGGFNTDVKVAFDTVDIDTASWWDATNHRYTPQQAGYYKVSSQIFAAPGIGGLTTLTSAYVFIAKNGTVVAQGGVGLAATTLGPTFSGISDIVHCNGSTDYIETDADLGGTGTASITGNATSVATIMAIHLIAPPLESAPPNYLTSASLTASGPIDPAQVIAAFTVFATWLADVQRGNISKTQ
jgi:hypothetical protein